MPKEELIENSISEMGLRCMHIVRTGKPVNCERWFKKVPQPGRSFITRLQNHEEDLDVYHLRMYWNPREAITIIENNGDKSPSVIWFIDDPGELVSIITDAVDYFLNMNGLEAKKVLLPVKYQAEEIKASVPVEVAGVPVGIVGWVPKHYLFVK